MLFWDSVWPLETLTMGSEQDIPMRLLLVEDDEEGREATARMLKKRGAEVIEVPDAEQAVQVLQETDLDGVVLDIKLPGMQGMDLLRLIREQKPDLPVVIMTGYGTLESACAAVNLHAQGFVCKPLENVDEILRPMTRAVDAQRFQEEKDRLYDEIRASEDRFRTIFHNANDMMCLYEMDENNEPGRFLEVNDRTCQTLGYSREEMLKMVVVEAMGEKAVEKLKENLAELLTNGHVPFECTCLRKDGTEIPVEVSSHLFEYEKKKVVLSIARDIGERRKTEQAIARALEQQKQSLGREVNDVLLADMLSTLTWTQMLKKELGKRAGPMPPDVEKIEESTTRALTFVRYLSAGLTPVEIGDEAINMALEELANDYQRMFGIPCEFRSSCEIRMNNGLAKFHLYRTAQEALSNAVTRAGAGRVTISLECSGREIVLQVEDDGTGLSQKAGDGMDLEIMRHRAKLVHGRLDISARPEGGTCVRCTCPVQ